MTTLSKRYKHQFFFLFFAVCQTFCNISPSLYKVEEKVFFCLIDK